MNKRTKALAISPAVKRRVLERDKGACVLCGRPGDPVCHFISRAQGGLGIEENIWNYEYEGSSDVIKVYIHHLRKKIDDNYEKKLLHTIKNVGYVIKED